MKLVRPGTSARRIAVVVLLLAVGFTALTPLALSSDNPRAGVIPAAAVGCLAAALGFLRRASAARRPQWHPDPSGEHLYRYWSGTDWTDRIADRVPTDGEPARPHSRDVAGRAP